MSSRSLTPKRSLLAGIVLLAALVPASARAAIDGEALLDALVQNGALTTEQAAKLAKDNQSTPSPTLVLAGSPTTRKLSLCGRIQAQFVELDSNDPAPASPAANEHFLMRRVLFGAKADLAPDWRAVFLYNFTGSFFELATVQWEQPGYTLEVGHRLVNLGREQNTSNGVLKAIERSAASRYLLECTNGTRLGAGSYRVGVFADGTAGDFFWGAALTNPEQASTGALSSTTGNSSTNQPAAWLNGGYTFKKDSRKLITGAGVGWLPDQGGLVTGTGNDIAIGHVFADYTAGRFALLTEVLAAGVQAGAQNGSDALVHGAYIQPSWYFTKRIEGVLRASYLDTDGRGVRLSDIVPGSPSTTLCERAQEFYLGASWYIKGNDIKLQTGLIYARADDKPNGSSATAETYGLRSQMQVNF
jgi:phosphate-selective porin